MLSRRFLLRVSALLFAAVSLAAAGAVAQDAPSVAEAARRAREQKQDAAKPAKVVTNDTLPSPPASTPAEAAASPAPPTDVAAPAAAESKTTAETAEDAEAKKQQTDSLRKQIAAKQDEINTQQGLVTLDQNSFNSNPDRSRDSAAKAKLDAEKADLERMQQEMADLKAELDAQGGVVESKPPAPRPSITQNAPQP